MHVTIVTPDKSFYDGAAESCTLVAHDGELGVLPGHAPLIARLGHGTARVLNAGKEHKIAVYGGFLKVQDDVVTVLAGGADVMPDTSDAAQTKARLEAAVAAVEKAVSEGKTGPELEELQEELRRARAYAELEAS